MFREILNTIGTKIASAVIALLILILTTQFLGADGRGLVSLIYSSIGIIGIFAGFVGGPALVYLAAKEKTQYLILPIYVWSFVISLIGALVIVLLRIIPIFYFIPVLILSVTSSVYLANLYILVGQKRIVSQNYIYLFQWFMNFFILGIFFTGFNLISVDYVILALFTSNSFGLLLTFKELKMTKNLTQFDWSEENDVIRTIVKYSFFAQAAAVMYYLYYRFGLFMLNYYSGLFSVGVYSVGVNLSDFILLASQSIALVVYSRVSNITDVEYSKRITIQLAKFSFLIVLGISMLMVILPAWLYSLVFGSDFSSVQSILITISPGIIAFGTTIVIFNYFAGIGKNHINAGAVFVGLCVNIGLSYLLIPVYGVYGAGISASISYIFTSLILIGLFLRETNLHVGDFYLRKEDITYLFFKIEELLS